jgi:hypothetical protein
MEKNNQKEIRVRNRLEGYIEQFKKHWIPKFLGITLKKDSIFNLHDTILSFSDLFFAFH